MSFVLYSPMGFLIPSMTRLLSGLIMVNLKFLTVDLIAVGTLSVLGINTCGDGSQLESHAPEYGYAHVLLLWGTGFSKCYDLQRSHSKYATLLQLQVSYFIALGSGGGMTSYVNNPTFGQGFTQLLPTHYLDKIGFTYTLSHKNSSKSLY